ncbi:MAG: DEAD/DEAH box helicase [Acidobacteriota bacterium]|nr:DEAD/DEAH box helicase [Acidobacteriota bacterium]MDE3170817.1 DEAD/DEAH box helicase [Acidobacteriota bacterium]
MQSFSELPISTSLLDRIAAAGFVQPTPVQAAAIPQALEGKDVLATAQTGTGKTLAYLAPIIETLLKGQARGISALVLGPTRELAIQVAEQYELLRPRQLPRAAVVVGGLSEGRQLEALRHGARLVIATPGRLEDFLDRRLIDLSAVRVLVLDEADRMLDMGFLPSIRRIASVLPKQRQTMCFSATLEASVAHLVHDYMRHPARIALGSTLKPSENVRMQAFEAPAGDKQEILRRLLAQETGRCLVFARTKRGAERLSWNLARYGLDAAVIHGDRSQSQRIAALEGFKRGRYRILVATDVAARGIHVEQVAHVINYDLPELAENFIHRVGRTGRAGERGVASVLYAREERGDLAQLERTLGIRVERMPLPAEVAASHASRVQAPAAKTRKSNPARSGSLAALPGEYLQAQMAD